MNRFLQGGVLLSAFATGACGYAGEIMEPAIPAADQAAEVRTPIWDWGPIGIATGGSKPCDPDPGPVYPTGAITDSRHTAGQGGATVANEPCNPDGDEPPICPTTVSLMFWWESPDVPGFHYLHGGTGTKVSQTLSEATYSGYLLTASGSPWHYVTIRGKLWSPQCLLDGDHVMHDVILQDEGWIW